MTTAPQVLVEAPLGARVEASELVGGVLTHAPESDGLRFLSALDRLCSALSDEARLTEAGRRSTRRSLVSALVLQLRLGRFLAAHPEIERLPFAFHRTPLLGLLWRDPGGHVTLKCPTHVWHLDALAATYPQGRLVRLHRAPAASVAAACSLTAVVRSARSDDVDRAEIGRYWTERAVAALATARRDGDVHGLPVLDLRSDDLVADPLAAVASVCEFADIRWTGGAERRVRRFLERNPQGRHGRHRYAPEEFGVSRVELEERLGDYRKEFGL